MNSKIVPVTKLRPKLLKCVDNAFKLGEEYIVTKNGKPAAVIVGFDEWENLTETREILADARTLKSIAKSRHYFKNGGKGKTIKQVFGP